jgi:uncharacterized membrane protein YhaH (DUF805 family)
VIEKYKKYFQFNGIANRSEYWGVTLLSYVALLIVVLIGIVFTFLGSIGSVMGLLIILFGLVMTGWVSLATTVRRCHDAGINAWFTLTIFIPWFGVIPWVVIGCLKTEPTTQPLSEG